MAGGKYCIVPRLFCEIFAMRSTTSLRSPAWSGACPYVLTSVALTSCMEISVTSTSGSSSCIVNNKNYFLKWLESLRLWARHLDLVGNLVSYTSLHCPIIVRRDREIWWKCHKKKFVHGELPLTQTDQQCSHRHFMLFKKLRKVWFPFFLIVISLLKKGKKPHYLLGDIYHFIRDAFTEIRDTPFRCAFANFQTLSLSDTW